jgi:hypothetical protein
LFSFDIIIPNFIIIESISCQKLLSTVIAFVQLYTLYKSIFLSKSFTTIKALFLFITFHLLQS